MLCRSQQLSKFTEAVDFVRAGNRCVYDQKAFNEVYVRCGWFAQKERERYDALATLLYPSALHNPWAIVLNPGFEVVWQHLRRRWETEEKKWREDDCAYIRHACDAYTLLKNNPRVLYIDHEIDLMTDRDTKTVKTWLARCFPQNYETHINKGQTSDALAAAAV